MNFTNNNILWKGKSATLSAMPKWSFPVSDTSDDNNKNTNSFGKANPIKHWRKQLQPVNVTGKSRSSVNIPFDAPGSTVSLGKTECNENAPCSKANILSTYLIEPPNNCSVKGPDGLCTTNKQAYVTKSATAPMKQNYYTNSTEYLKSRCKTYSQNLSGTKSLEDKDSNSYSRNMTNCSNSKCAKLTYKKNNKPFGVQGAVSSSSRIDRLKYNTIQTAAKSLQSAYGSSTANANAYKGLSGPVYTEKSKTQEKCYPSLYHKNGNKTVC